MADGGMPPGEVTGWIAGLAALFGGPPAIAKTVKWLADRADRRRQRREDKIQAWQDEVDAKARELDKQREGYVARLEGRLSALERGHEARDIQLRALRLAFELVSTALRQIDPENQALVLANDLLRSAFAVPIDDLPDAVKLLGDLSKTPA